MAAAKTLYCPFQTTQAAVEFCNRDGCALWVVSALNGEACAFHFLGLRAALKIDDLSRQELALGARP